MQIKSNTLGKLQKIRDGKVFESPLIFIRELLQNSQRSKATRVDFLVLDGEFICKDDGCGCNNPENVFTLDLSSWESIQEGYGIGFWSCLCVPAVKSIIVESKDWICSIEANNIFENGDLSVKKEKSSSKICGFKVTIKSDYFDSNSKEVEKYIYDVAKFLPFDVTVNECLMPKQDLFDSFVPETFCKMYNNRLFKAKFAISRNCYTEPSLYYDKRFVSSFGYLDYVEGVFEVKADKITLREPDRTSFIRDDKHKILCDKLQECIKDLFLSYIRQSGLNDESYNSAIEYWLDVKDYEKYLEFDTSMIDSMIDETVSPEKEPVVELVEENDDEIDIACDIDSSRFEKKDIVVTQHLKKVACTTTSNSMPIKEASFKDKIKKMRKAVWVSKSEYSFYQNYIQKAKYKGLKVIIARNILYETALRRYGVMHISGLEDAFTETFIKSNIQLKTSKEEAFVSLLKPIVKKYNLAYDTFLIANIAIESSFVVNGETVFKTKHVNRKNDINVFGVTDGSHIYLDRVALELNKFNIKKDNLGVWELKALMNSVNTIAHELAHLLYGTTDNTPEHYNYEITIQREIISLYV